MLGAAWSRTASIFWTFFFLCLVGSRAEAQIHFSLPAQPLAQAITAVGGLANVNIYFDPSQVKDVTAPALNADLDVEQALARLLAGTRLHVVHVDASTLRVVEDKGAADKGAAHGPFGGTSGSGAYADRSTRVSFDQAVSGNERSAAEGAALTPPDSSDTLNAESKNSRPAALEMVVVTGSRLGDVPAQGAQPIDVYARADLESSGQVSLTDFLNTLPSVSVAQTVFGSTTINGGGTVQLHGLPVGTTLVLINGRTVGSSGGQSAFGVNVFDLNTIPVAAIDRVEVIPTGSSAIYGSDAIAGVVNIILRSNFDALELSAKYAGAVGTDATNAQFAWGKKSDRWSFSFIANYDRQTELIGADRALTSTNDFMPYGGPDNRVSVIANPGNVFSINGTPLPGLGSATYAAVPPGFHGTPTVSEFANTADTLNKISLAPYTTLLPAFRRVGLLSNGGYELTDTVHLFAELLYSESQESTGEIPPYLVGLPGYQQYTVSAANPYNPFGVEVGINRLLTEYGRQVTKTPDDFVRALLGVRGKFLEGWEWEFATWDVEDHARLWTDNQINPVAVQTAINSTNPATALDPFVAGPIGSPALLKTLLGSDAFVRALSRKLAANGFVRGTLLQLPAGPLSVVLGSEYDADKLDSDKVNYAGTTNFRAIYNRDSYAVFTEARIPVFGSPATRESILALTAAARYDHDQYFGGETTPQFGLEIRPESDLLVRGTYGRAFKAPSLLSLFEPEISSVFYGSDPRKGGAAIVVSNLLGGNANLKPETGHSTTAGISYTPRPVPGLGLSLTFWEVTEQNSIQSIDAQTLINNEKAFPGRVVRNAAGDITEVDSTLVNFGTINVRGLDYQVNWKHPMGPGVLDTSASATQTYHYVTSLLPGLPAQDRVSQAATDLNWAPRWKGIVRASWSQGPVSVGADGRYIGKYRDYLPMPDGVYQTLGNFWIMDLNAKISLKEPRWLSVAAPQTDLEIGAVNALNRLPQYSNNPYIGYDGTQADIRGRFLYARITAHW